MFPEMAIFIGTLKPQQLLSDALSFFLLLNNFCWCPIVAGTMSTYVQVSRAIRSQVKQWLPVAQVGPSPLWPLCVPGGTTQVLSNCSLNV